MEPEGLRTVLCVEMRVCLISFMSYHELSIALSKLPKQLSDNHTGLSGSFSYERPTARLAMPLHPRLLLRPLSS
jgi:hypothetical protein